MEKKISRGIRNNNPGNIRLSNDPWQGLSEVQNDKEFFQFKSMAYGIRAIARTLITYQDKYNIRTIKKMAERYAPAADNNDTVDYYMKVCAIAKIYDHDKVLDFHTYKDLKPVIWGIIYKENAPDHLLVKQVDIDKGLSLAGVEPEKKPLITKKQAAIAAPIVIASGSTLYQNIDMINNTIVAFYPSLNFFQKIYSFAPWIAGVLLVGAAGYIIYDRIMAKKKGL